MINGMPSALFHVDAFAAKPFEGNPAAVCPLNGWLDDEQLRQVAAENNLSETAFFVARDGVAPDDHHAHYELRWFTPRCEVKLCGHATLASGFVLLNILHPGRKSVRFETRHSGALTVSRDGDLLSMDFPAIPPRECPHPPEKLFRALGAEPVPLTVIEGNSKYLVVYESEQVVRSVRPDFRLLEQLHPFTVGITAPGEQSDFVSRYFAPSYGVPEDPVTGSAHCTLTPYWSAQLGKTHLHARQVSERGGELWCEMGRERVVLKGNAVLTLRGQLLIEGLG
jgi:PhzF family phenazine biosynthesis protein